MLSFAKAVVVIAFVLGWTTSARAVPVEIHFYGIATQCFTCGGQSGPYTGQITYDFDVSPYTSASLSLPWQGVFISAIATSIGNFIDINADGYNHLSLDLQSGGYVQYGTCPSRCALLTASLGEPPSAVPGPLVGAGLPGLLMTIAGFIGWRRSRHPLRSKYIGGLQS